MTASGLRSKVFGIGYPRTGTMSLVAALDHLGIRSLHNPTGLVTDDAEELLAAYDGFADAPVPLVYRELDARFPGSKFVLTDRDVDAWLSSVEWMIESGRKYGAWDASPGIVAMHEALYGSADFRKQEYRRRFLQHREEVGAYFADRPGSLLVMDLARGDGWDRLCPFLGLPVPRAPFPRHNRRVRFPSLFRIRRKLGALLRSAWGAGR